MERVRRDRPTTRRGRRHPAHPAGPPRWPAAPRRRHWSPCAGRRSRAAPGRCPSRRTCSTTWTAPANWACRASRPMPPSAASASNRAGTSPALLACTVPALRLRGRCSARRADRRLRRPGPRPPRSGRAASAAPAGPGRAARSCRRLRHWPAGPPAAPHADAAAGSSSASSTVTSPLVGGDGGEQRRQQGGLAGAGTAGDQEGQPRPQHRTSGRQGDPGQAAAVRPARRGRAAPAAAPAATGRCRRRRPVRARRAAECRRPAAHRRADGRHRAAGRPPWPAGGPAAAPLPRRRNVTPASCQPCPRSTRTSPGELTTTSVVAGSASNSASGPAPTSSRCSIRDQPQHLGVADQHGRTPRAALWPARSGVGSAPSSASRRCTRSMTSSVARSRTMRSGAVTARLGQRRLRTVARIGT